MVYTSACTHTHAPTNMCSCMRKLQALPFMCACLLHAITNVMLSVLISSDIYNNKIIIMFNDKNSNHDNNNANQGSI